MIRRFIQPDDRELEFFVLCPHCQQHEPTPVFRYAAARRVFRAHMCTKHPEIRRYNGGQYNLATAFGVWLTKLRNEEPQEV